MAACRVFVLSLQVTEFSLLLNIIVALLLGRTVIFLSDVLVLGNSITLRSALFKYAAIFDAQ
jgi:hypothetical protein